MARYPQELTEEMSSEARLDALAAALAEGFLYLAENGLLDGDSQATSEEANQKPGSRALTSGRTEGIPSFDGTGRADGY